MSSSYNRQYYIDYIKLQVSANLLTLEIPDDTIGKYVDAALVELQRYIDETRIVTVPFAKCIDLKDWKHNAIVKVYRTEGYTGDTTTGITTSEVDPLYAQTWMAFSSGGAGYNLQNYIYNYAAYSTLLQMKNTLSTDMAFREDKYGNKLYINSAYDAPMAVTIEYIPIFENVEMITSNYWIDILKRLSLAMVKAALGRIRTRFSQSNGLFGQDGETLLNEGNTELNELRQFLSDNSMLFMPID